MGKKSNKRNPPYSTFPRPAGLHGGIKNSLNISKRLAIAIYNTCWHSKKVAIIPLKQFAPFLHENQRLSAVLQWEIPRRSFVIINLKREAISLFDVRCSMLDVRCSMFFFYYFRLQPYTFSLMFVFIRSLQSYTFYLLPLFTFTNK